MLWKVIPWPTCTTSCGTGFWGIRQDLVVQGFEVHKPDRRQLSNLQTACAECKF